MLLVVLRLPSSAAAFAQVAAATGLGLADVRARLTGPLPRPLLLDADGDRAQRAVEALETLGFGVLAFDPAAVPKDDERLVARGIELGARRLVVSDGAGEREEIDPAGLILIQTGARSATKTETTKKSERRFAPARAILSSGLILTKKVETEVKRSTTSEERFAVFHRADGGRDVIVYERRLDYRFLGADQQPSSHANLQRFLECVRALAPHAPHDDRVARPGLVASLRNFSASTDPVDVALMVVLLAHLRRSA